MRSHLPQRNLRASAIKSVVSLVVVLAFVAGIAGMFYYQHIYFQHHLPLVRAGVAAAEQQGLVVFEGIPVPDDATPSSTVERKTIFGLRHSMWRNEPIGASWVQLWDAPGDHPAIDAWYREKLLADGWRPFVRQVPSSVQTQYWKDKWLLTVEHEATFAEEHPPHARFRLRLMWDYWHSFQ